MNHLTAFQLIRTSEMRTEGDDKENQQPKRQNHSDNNKVNNQNKLYDTDGFAVPFTPINKQAIHHNKPTTHNISTSTRTNPVASSSLSFSASSSTSASTVNHNDLFFSPTVHHAASILSHIDSESNTLPNSHNNNHPQNLSFHYLPSPISSSSTSSGLNTTSTSLLFTPRTHAGGSSSKILSYIDQLSDSVYHTAATTNKTLHKTHTSLPLQSPAKWLQQVRQSIPTPTATTIQHIAHTLSSSPPMTPHHHHPSSSTHTHHYSFDTPTIVSERVEKVKQQVADIIMTFTRLAHNINNHTSSATTSDVTHNPSTTTDTIVTPLLPSVGVVKEVEEETVEQHTNHHHPGDANHETTTAVTALPPSHDYTPRRSVVSILHFTPVAPTHHHQSEHLSNQGGQHSNLPDDRYDRPSEEGGGVNVNYCSTTVESGIMSKTDNPPVNNMHNDNTNHNSDSAALLTQHHDGTTTTKDTYILPYPPATTTGATTTPGYTATPQTRLLNRLFQATPVNPTLRRLYGTPLIQKLLSTPKPMLPSSANNDDSTHTTGMMNTPSSHTKKKHTYKRVSQYEFHTDLLYDTVQESTTTTPSSLFTYTTVKRVTVSFILLTITIILSLGIYHPTTLPPPLIHTYHHMHQQVDTIVERYFPEEVRDLCVNTWKHMSVKLYEVMTAHQQVDLYDGNMIQMDTSAWSDVLNTHHIDGYTDDTTYDGETMQQPEHEEIYNMYTDTITGSWSYSEGDVYDVRSDVDESVASGETMEIKSVAAEEVSVGRVNEVEQSSSEELMESATPYDPIEEEFQTLQPMSPHLASPEATNDKNDDAEAVEEQYSNPTPDHYEGSDVSEWEHSMTPNDDALRLSEGNEDVTIIQECDESVVQEPMSEEENNGVMTDQLSAPTSKTSSGSSYWTTVLKYVSALLGVWLVICYFASQALNQQQQGANKTTAMKVSQIDGDGDMYSRVNRLMRTPAGEYADDELDSDEEDQDEVKDDDAMDIDEDTSVSHDSFSSLLRSAPRSAYKAAASVMSQFIAPTLPVYRKLSASVLSPSIVNPKRKIDFHDATPMIRDSKVTAAAVSLSYRSSSTVSKSSSVRQDSINVTPSFANTSMKSKSSSVQSQPQPHICTASLGIPCHCGALRQGNSSNSTTASSLASVSKSKRNAAASTARKNVPPAAPLNTGEHDAPAQQQSTSTRRSTRARK